MKKVKVVVVGGGWAGCSAAVGAAKAGAEVTLLERTDMILGTGLVGGIMRNNGRFTATEEMIAMGGGDLFNVCDMTARHKNIEFPGHKHANLYDIATTPVEVYNHLFELGVKVVLEARVKKIEMEDKKITSVSDEAGRSYNGDVFVDTTGTAGPMNNCNKYGNGCAMCVLRCPSFGGRISLAGLAGVEEITGKKKDGSIGAMSGSCKLYKESLSEEIQDRLNKFGVAVIPVPEDLTEDHLDAKACQQYALTEFKENLVLLDTGHAKLMTPFYKLDTLRKIPGCERARYEDPYSGGKGNSIRYFNMSPRDNRLKVEGVENLFCAGEKAGLLVGHTEAMVTGILAGNNSVRYALKEELIELPESLAIGDAIKFVKTAMETPEGMGKKFTFSGSVYFDRMKSLGLYSTDTDEIKARIEKEGLTGVFAKKLT
ncbi:FAD-dependent oxidoreductase [Alkalibacter mobilis]|uniref:FAD-dependent oxidoreductase n=1 Tax=Alkalibacter mobilis TaxID=2787712 RepID=UPI00189FFB9C|nr:FAD-dependent oxidoreductase [Alkalibacter mobilis]MBF7097725.1 FAD-dependent oxidoreductase [Alkalibacter mobilis]